MNSTPFEAPKLAGVLRVRMREQARAAVALEIESARFEQALSRAVAAGDADLLREMLETASPGVLEVLRRPAERDFSDEEDLPLPAKAVRFGQPECFDLLVGGGVGTEITCSKSGDTIAHLACEVADPEHYLGSLGRFGRSVDAPNKSGVTPLWHALHLRNQAAVATAAAVGADVNRRLPNGMRPLEYALAGAQDQSAVAIIENGAEVNARMTYTYLQMATILNAEPQVIGALLEAGADENAQIPVKRPAGEKATPEEQRWAGATATTLALYMGRPGVVRMMLESGARTDIPDARGFTLVDHARMVGGVMHEMVQAAAHRELEDPATKLAREMQESGQGVPNAPWDALSFMSRSPEGHGAFTPEGGRFREEFSGRFPVLDELRELWARQSYSDVERNPNPFENPSWTAFLDFVQQGHLVLPSRRPAVMEPEVADVLDHVTQESNREQANQIRTTPTPATPGLTA